MPQRLKPEPAFKLAYADIHMACDQVVKMADKNVGNMTRKETERLCHLLQQALCAATALNNWRRMNPLPEHRENEVSQ